MKLRLPGSGCNLREVLRVARALVVVTTHHGGELLLLDRRTGHRVVVSACRKDASRASTAFLRRVWQSLVER